MMADKPAAEKTEQPTPRKLGKAREEGQVPQSQDMGSAVTVVVLLLSLFLLAPNMFQWFRLKVESGLTGGTEPFTDPQAFNTYFNARLLDAMVVTLPILAALSLAGIFTGLAISGISFSPNAVQLKWDAINPATVLQRGFSMRTVIRLLSSMAKLILVGIIVWFYLRDQLDVLTTLRWAWSTQIIAIIAKITFGLGIRVGITMIILGLADTVYQKWQHIQDLKMTRQEVKLERKSSDGSPEVKSRIRRLQLEMSMKRLTQEVPRSSKSGAPTASPSSDGRRWPAPSTPPSNRANPYRNPCTWQLRKCWRCSTGSDKRRERPRNRNPANWQNSCLPRRPRGGGVGRCLITIARSTPMTGVAVASA